MLNQKQIAYRGQYIVNKLSVLDIDDQKAIVAYACEKMFGEESIPAEARAVETIAIPDSELAAMSQRDQLFWIGLDKNLRLGDPPTLKLYSEIMERQAAIEVTRDLKIFIEHDDIPDMVLRTALTGTGVDFGSTCKGIEEAEAVPYSPPG